LEGALLSHTLSGISIFRLRKERDARHPRTRAGQAILKSNREVPAKLKEILGETLEITIKKPQLHLASAFGM